MRSAPSANQNPSGLKSLIGRVIGRSGKVASAMRTLVRVAAVKHGLRATLDIR
jgi:predicted RNA-binding protein YlqC (UPF0109 family)